MSRIPAALKRLRALGLALLVCVALAPSPESAAKTDLGVVTAVTGRVIVTRGVSPSSQAAVQFRDALLPRDVITTPPQSTVRFLLDGATSVTLGERSEVRIETALSPAGGQQITLRLLAGRMAVASVRALLRVGDAIVVATPNGCASGQGMVLLATYAPPAGSAAAPAPNLLLAADRPVPVSARIDDAPGGTSSFVALADSLTITSTYAPPLTLEPFHRVRVTTADGVQASAMETVTPAQVARAAPALPLARSHAAPPRSALAEIQLAAALVNLILDATAAQRPAAQTMSALTSSRGPTPTAAPVVPQVQPIQRGSADQQPGAPTSPSESPAGNPNPSQSDAGLINGGAGIVFSGGTAPALIPTTTPLAIAGSLLSLQHSTLHIPGEVPLASIRQAILVGGSGTDNQTGALLNMVDASIEMGGPLLEATDNSTITFAGAGNMIRLDTALMAATAPVINLINSTLMTSPTGDGNGAMYLYRSTVTSRGAFNLDNSQLTVQNGPLLSLAGGSSMTISGDFATLLNQSTLTVLNGPLIAVNGAGATGTPSTLTVTGALINFGGTGGNKLIIKNALAPTATLSGIPVTKDPASSITIGPTPIKNLGTLGTVNVTGSLIQTTGGGRVTINAP